MYLRFYGLREEPFGVTPDPRFLYPSPSYQEAQATLEYGIRSGRGFTALIAQPGMGKTTLLFHLLERYSQAARTAFIFLTQCDSREFMRYLMAELGTDTGESDFVRLQDQFGQLLAREAQAGRKVIAVVDEAQNLDIRVLETVRLLSDFETPRAKLLHIILAGQPELADRLASPALLQLRQRISHLVRLEPLSAAEVNRYIDHRLRMAGYGGGPLFSAEARTLIGERSRGIPRIINNLCFNALSLGFATGQRIINAQIVGEVSDDLDFEAITVQKVEPAATAAAEKVAAVKEKEEEKEEQPSQDAAGESEEANAMAAAAPAYAVAAPSGGGSGEEKAPIGAPPGPVLVPAAQAPGTATEKVASIEMGNLALRIMPVEVSTTEAGAMAEKESGAEAPPAPAGPVQAGSPGNHSNGTGEAGKSKVDVEALASDCALFGMESPRRWKRPMGNGVKPAPAGPAPRRNATGITARPNAPRAVGTPAAGGVARPANQAGSAVKAPIAPINQGVRGPAGAQGGKLWPERPPNGGDARQKRRQRNLYLAAGGSALFLLILIWLLSTSAPGPASKDAAESKAPAQGISTQADPATPDATATNDSGSVLDVVDEVPPPGAEGGGRDTRPAVVMRANHGGELLHRVDPVYPAAARENGIQGPVVLDATIGDHGFLRHIRVLSGDPLLADAVLDAVRGWRYRPHMQHGRPVQTETRIVVNFQLVPGRNTAQNR